jgi:hypothetical protein
MTTPIPGPRGFPLWEKDPDADKDYVFDWSAWLGADVIQTSTWVVDAGLTVGTGPKAPSHDGATATVWLSGGTVNKVYRVTNRVVTTGGRTDDRTAEIWVKQQ